MSKVLIVDDDPVFRRLHVYILRADGHETAEAETLGSAILLCQNDQFDVVVADHFMPDGSGLELLDVLDTLEPRPRFLLISGAPGLEDPRLDRVDLYLSKPVSSSDLQAAVAATTGSSNR